MQLFALICALLNPPVWKEKEDEIPNQPKKAFEELNELPNERISWMYGCLAVRLSNLITVSVNAFIARCMYNVHEYMKLHELF